VPADRSVFLNLRTNPGFHKTFTRPDFSTCGANSEECRDPRSSWSSGNQPEPSDLGDATCRSCLVSCKLTCTWLASSVSAAAGGYS